MKRMIINLGNENEFLHFENGSSVCLKPNEFYFYENKEGEEVDYPELEPSRLISWTFPDCSELIKTTIVGNHWDVKSSVNETIVSGSWKKEGF